MLRPLIEHHWTQDVARWTRITTEDEQLRSHLFGRERAAFPKVLVGGLLELQSGSCQDEPTRPSPRRLTQQNTTECQTATDTTVTQLPEPRPETVTHLPKPRCPA